jgi:hypothetical protein
VDKNAYYITLNYSTFSVEKQAIFPQIHIKIRNGKNGPICKRPLTEAERWGMLKKNGEVALCRSL